MNNGILRKALLLSCISGAAHFTRAFFTVYGALLVSADVICITEFGFMIAIQFLPGSIIPLAIGFIMHENPRMLHTAVIILNVASLASYLAFIAGLAVSSKNLMIVSIAFLGLTSCSLSPLQRATISSSFKVIYHGVDSVVHCPIFAVLIQLSGKRGDCFRHLS